jgi:hypothetical protein
MTEALNKIKTLIEESKSFGLLLDPNPEEHEFLAREILEQVITQKKLPIVSLPELSKINKEKWSPVLKEKLAVFVPHKTSIRLPKQKYLVEEVAYEENEEYLSFVLTPKKGGLLKEDLVLENLPPQVDTAFCLFENETKIETFKNDITLPSKEKIVYITPNEKTITEKVFSIAEIFNPNILTDKNISTLLFAALLKETNEFSENITKETLSLGSLFLENGARKETINSITEKEKTAFSAQILGRMLARTYIDDVMKTSWSFLNQRDMQKTNQVSVSPNFLYNLLKKIRTLIPPQKLHVLIWQSKEGIRALITAAAHKNEQYLLPLAQKFQTEPQSRFFIVGPFENFSQAESKLRQTLKEEINNL